MKKFTAYFKMNELAEKYGKDAKAKHIFYLTKDKKYKLDGIDAVFENDDLELIQEYKQIKRRVDGKKSN